ncbi:MAG: sensor histidine kinase [Desulfococcaceae bacterium]
MPIRFPRSLAFRLTLWYGVVFTLSAAGVLLALYLVLAALLREETDRALLSQFRTFRDVAADKSTDAVRRMMILEAQAAGERKIFIRLLTPDGAAYSSTNMSHWREIRAGRDAIRRILEGAPFVFESREDPEGRSIRLLYGMVGPGVMMQLGRSLETLDRFSEVFRRIAWIMLAGLPIISGLSGWFLSRKALSGLEAVTRTAIRISKGELNRRAATGHGSAEVDRLAQAFNRMLDRISDLLAHMREMSDNIAHDLKSPITRIRGLAEITLTTGKSLEEYERMAADTVEECDRLLAMINAMLTISRTEAGVEPLQLEAMDLAGRVQDMCELFRPMAEDRGIRLECRAPDHCTFYGDARLLQRLMGNLLDNAIKFTPEGGAVFVALDALAPEIVELTVADTGPGIDPADHPRVFDRFFRTDPARSASGAGLGLSLARAIATAHRGQISLDSRPGAGAVFTVSLPSTPPAPVVLSA